MSSHRTGVTVCLMGLALMSGAGCEQARADQFYITAPSSNSFFGDALYIIDPNTGKPTQTVGDLLDATGQPYSVRSLAFQPGTGVLYAATTEGSVVARGHLITIDRTTARVTDIGSFATTSFGAPSTFGDLAFDRTTGILYGVRADDDRWLYMISLTTGTATKVGSGSRSDFGGTGLAASAAGTLFATPDGANIPFGIPTLRTLDNTTGNATLLASLTAGPNPYAIDALDFDSSGVLFGIEESLFRREDRLAKINTLTGVLTDIGATLDGAAGLAILGANDIGKLILNYVQIGEQVITPTRSNVTYRADLINPRPAQASVSASVTSLDPFSVRVLPGEDTLTFAPVPGNSQVTSNNTFTIQIDKTVPFSFSKLQWTFQSAVAPPVANAGPNRTVKVGSSVALDGSSSMNPSGFGFLTYSWVFTSRPPGTSTRLFYTNSINPTFIPDVPGMYTLALTVSNGDATSTASVTVVATPFGASAQWTPAAHMLEARTNHTATLLQDGKVLIIGGDSAFRSISEIYNPALDTFTLTGYPIGEYHSASTATLLEDGRVLVVGEGRDSIAAEVYNPSTGAFALTGSTTSAHAGFTATLLKSGKVLILGGYDNNNGATGIAELYDPATGTFTRTGSLNDARGYHAATALPDGDVLVTGGVGQSSCLNSAERYHPATGLFTRVGSMAAERCFITAAALANGDVLVLGDLDGPWPELYSASAAMFRRIGPMITPRYSPTTTLLGNGQLLIAGGEPYNGPGVAKFTNSAELYDPAKGMFTVTSSMAVERIFHAATLLRDGRVLVTGGYTDVSSQNSAELYIP